MYREARPGLDLPASFMDELRGIDPDLHFIWHRYRCLWDTFINKYEGEKENPRYTVEEKYGYTNFGFVLTDNNGDPISENKWHIWRWCRGVDAWAHVIDVDSKKPSHLEKIVSNIVREAKMANMTRRQRMNLMQEEQEEQLQKKQAKSQDLWKEVNKANSKLMKSAAENFASGVTAPTNPTKEIISSFRGQTNRSKIVRPLTDTEGGLILPEDWSK